MSHCSGCKRCSCCCSAPPQLRSIAVAVISSVLCLDLLLNPQCSALASDILQYRLQPLVRVPHLVVCGVGEDWKETHALPLSAVSPAEWVRLEASYASDSSVVVREGELLLTGGDQHDCSILSPRTGRWRDGPSMPTKRQLHCSAQLGGLSVVWGLDGWCGLVNAPPARWRCGAVGKRM